MNPGSGQSRREITAARRQELKRLQANGILLEDRLAPKGCDARYPNQVSALHPGGEWFAVGSSGRLGLLHLVLAVTFRELSIGGEWDVGATMSRELNRPEFERGFAELKQQEAPAQQAFLDKLLQAQKEVSLRARPVPLEYLMSLCFTPDGHWLICGTTRGVRVFAWANLIKPAAGPVPWDYAASAEQIDPERPEGASTVVRCVGFDSLRQRVLFCDEDGKLKYLELGTGRSGHLHAGPERTPITHFALSACRTIITLERMHGGRGDERRAKFQTWNYPALCAAAGLEF